MSLNWAQVTAKPFAPVPLPGERLVYQLDSAEVVLEVPPTLEGPKWSTRSTGTVWITNQRLVFAAPTALSAAADDALPPAHLSTPPGSLAVAPAGTVLGSATSYLSSWLPTASAPSSSHPPLHSLSIPLNSLTAPAFAQPLLGSNHIVLSFMPSTGGGLPSASGITVSCRIYPIEGRGWEAFERLQRARIWAMDARPAQDVETEALPVYPGRS